MLLLLKNAFAPNLHQATCKLLFILNILVRMILHHARHVAAARSEAEAGAELGAAVMLHFAVNALFAIGVLLT